MKKEQIASFLAENTRCTKDEYLDLLIKLESNYNVVMNWDKEFLSLKNIPNTFSEKPIITYDDDQVGAKLGVSGDIISELRAFSGIMSRATGKNYEPSEIDLSNLTDEQKTLMTQISYLDLTQEGFEKINNEGLKVSELSKYLAHPNDQFPGNVVMHEGLTKVVTNAIVGKNSIITESELLKDIQAKGLGELTITAIASDNVTGFQAMALRDDYDNTAISFRGSDFNYGKGGLSDWIFTDGWEWLTDNSKQRTQAIQFFDENSNENGNNYVYGHSLGGNLTTHTLLARANEIEEAFTIDGTPVSDRVVKMKDNQEILNSDKYNCNVVAGDVVGQLKSFTGYEDNVTFVQNNEHLNYSLISAHLTQSATYDKEGNFKTCDKETAIEEMGKFEKWFTNISQTVHGVVNDGLEAIDDVTAKFEASKVGQWLGNIRDNVVDFFDNDKSNDNDNNFSKDDCFLSVDD